MGEIGTLGNNRTKNNSSFLLILSYCDLFNLQKRCNIREKLLFVCITKGKHIISELSAWCFLVITERLEEKVAFTPF